MFGLCVPSYNSEYGTHKAASAQRKVWAQWVTTWDDVDAWATGRKLVVFCGDMLDFDIKRRSSAYITNNKAMILDLAADTLKPALDVVDDLHMIRGTPAHVGRDAEYEDLLAADLGAPIDWHLTGTIEGLRVDIAHQTNMGGLPWTEANAVNQLARRVMTNYDDIGERRPGLIVRAHVHRHYDTWDNFAARTMTLPCWQLPTEYIQRLNPGRAPHIGLVALKIEDGQITDTKKWITKTPTTRPWTKTI